MIKGVGIDLVELERIKELLSDRFIERILSEKEMKEYQNLAHEQVKLEWPRRSAGPRRWRSSPT